MSRVDRDPSSERTLTKQASWTELGRSSIPMWDSSDPERAPPPLPLNPVRSTPNGSPVKANTSATVAAAAQALVDKAFESSSPSTTRQHVERSETRSPTRSPQHRRLQSLQAEGNRSRRRDGERKWTDLNPWQPATANIPLEISMSRPRSASPRLKARPTDDTSTETLAAERSLSRTMSDAAKTARDAESLQPLGDITNRPMHIIKTTAEADGVHQQMLHLTTIASSLQKEMTALSRRSKDNAADLIALKEATKKRDEDIRTSLRELLLGQKETRTSKAPIQKQAAFPTTSDLEECGKPAEARNLFSRNHGQLTDHSKTGPLRRSASGNSPNPSILTNAAVDTLDRIARDMVTKEGQGLLVADLMDLLGQTNRESSNIVKRVEEVLEHVKETYDSKALVKLGGQPPISDSDALLLSKTHAHNVIEPFKASPLISGNDVDAVLRKIRESVTHTGCMTADLKANTKDLRGEILGMGRDLARKIDLLQGDMDRKKESSDATLREQVGKLVYDELNGLKSHIDATFGEKCLEQFLLPLKELNNRVGPGNEVYFRGGDQDLTDYDHDLSNDKQLTPTLTREEILEAVKEAYDDYKPEIEVQHFGLDRDEILQCLREGLEDHRESSVSAPRSDMSNDELFATIREEIQRLPERIVPSNILTKEDMAAVVHECLHEIRLSNVNARNLGADVHPVIMDAVKEGLGHFKREHAREIEIDSNDLFEAVKAGLESMPTPFGAYGQQVLDSLREIVDGMQIEFQQYSAANGRDTEQVLDALKDGLESLRAEVESYVDKAQDITGKDEIITTLKSEAEKISTSLETIQDQRESSALLDSKIISCIQTEFERLHDDLSAQLSGTDFKQSQRSIADRLDTLHHGIHCLNSNNANVEEVLDLVKNLHNVSGSGILKSNSFPDFEELREMVKQQLTEGQMQTSSEQAQAFQELIQLVRDELQNHPSPLPKSLSREDAEASAFGDGDGPVNRVLAQIQADLSAHAENFALQDRSQSTRLSNLQESLSDLQTELSKLGQRYMDTKLPEEVFEDLRHELVVLRSDIESIRSHTNQDVNDKVVLAESSRDAMMHSEAPARAQSEPSHGLARSADIERLELMIAQLQIKLEALNSDSTAAAQSASKGPATENDQILEDVAMIRSAIEDVRSTLSKFDTLGSGTKESHATRDDTDALETLMQNTKAKLDEQILPLLEVAATRDNIENLETISRLTREKVEEMNNRVPNDLAKLENIISIETLLSDISVGLETLEAGLGEVSSRPSVGKEDIDVLGVTCAEIKMKLEELSSRESTATTSDVETLLESLDEVRDFQEKLKSDLDNGRDFVENALENRRLEIDAVLENVVQLRDEVEQSKNDLKSRMKRSNEDVRALDEILIGIEEKLDSAPNAVSDVHDLQEQITEEFEQTANAVELLRNEQKTGLDGISEKLEALQTKSVDDIGIKIEQGFSTLCARHEEQHQVLKDISTSSTEKQEHQDSLLSEVRALTDNIMVAMDTLKDSMDGISPAIVEVTERSSDDSKTVFNRIDEMHSMMEEYQTESKTAQHLTRTEVTQLVALLETMQQNGVNHDPQISDKLIKLNVFVEQIWEQMKTFQETADRSSDRLKAHIDEGLKSLPAPNIEETPTHNYMDRDEMSEKLSALTKSVEVHAYNDTDLQSQIQLLIEQTKQMTTKNEAVDKIDALTAQLNGMASRLDEFFTDRHRLPLESDISRANASQGKLADSKHYAEEAQYLEMDITALRETKSTLLEEVELLKSEQRSLAAQKSRFASELASLETALKFRREELHIMNAKVEVLERRIMDGFLDQSKMLLKPKNATNVNLKRVNSNTSSMVRSPKRPLELLRQNASLATKSKLTLGNDEQPMKSDRSARRIMSLSEISNNADPRTRKITETNQALQRNPINFKRSQSVRNPNTRKMSWGSTKERRLEPTGQENSFIAEEYEENAHSDRESRSASVVCRSITQDYVREPAKRQASVASMTSEFTDLSESYFENSEEDRRFSYDSMNMSNVGGIGTSSLDDSLLENTCDQGSNGSTSRSSSYSRRTTTHFSDQDVEERYKSKVAEDVYQPGVFEAATGDSSKDLIVARPPGSDSGLGSDLPTVTLSAHPGEEYFGPNFSR